jgi:hypothetical protein
MSQLDRSRYRQITNGSTYAQDDGFFYDRTLSQVCFVLGDTILARWDANGLTADIEVASEARGDILRRGASAWERLSAKTSGQVLVGDGTDLVSVAVSGDATLAANGALTVADVTLGSDAQGDLHYKSSATVTARLAKGTAGQALVMNAGATAPEWVSTGVLYAAVSIPSADITDVAAGKLGHANGYEIIAAPASGKAIEVISAVVINDYDTAAYTDGGNLTLNYVGASAVTGAVSAANSLGAAADKVALVLGAVPTNNQLVAAAAINLVSSAAFTQPGTAAGVCRVKVAYRIHTTGL